ncbi:hypothetical protein [Candidatus Halocynthiibacter alkanivorans]|uniref:hypothetical protein n=1 Tax=Candidatus Halocynthiibacter alkanivorans TaxID=2267619 RepID=UPI00109D78BB|nr:hypothetical protein [Candidatus Halocynthiibacter alkanivorans]
MNKGVPISFDSGSTFTSRAEVPDPDDIPVFGKGVGTAYCATAAPGVDAADRSKVTAGAALAKRPDFAKKSRRVTLLEYFSLPIVSSRLPDLKRWAQYSKFGLFFQCLLEEIAVVVEPSSLVDGAFR